MKPTRRGFLATILGALFFRKVPEMEEAYKVPTEVVPLMDFSGLSNEELEIIFNKESDMGFVTECHRFRPKSDHQKHLEAHEEFMNNDPDELQAMIDKVHEQSIGEYQGLIVPGSSLEYGFNWWDKIK